MDTTIDKKEIEFFSKFTKEWWDTEGPLGALHKLTDSRVKFILRNTSRIAVKNNFYPLSGLKCIDIGCGGGILSERLKRLGGTITGIDISKKAINVAIEHANKSKLDINYESISTSSYLKKYKNVKFDVVIASEVIEHVDNRMEFLSDLSKIVKENGLVILTTLNKSITSIIIGKFVAENILKIVPKGSHDIEKFVTPEKLIQEAKEFDIFFDDLTGFSPTFTLSSIIERKIHSFKTTSYPIINYGIAGLKVTQ